MPRIQSRSCPVMGQLSENMHDTSAVDRIGERRFRTLISASGIAGSILLVVYFSAPFVIFPFPPSSASPSQIVSSANQYQLEYMLAAWLQGTGTLLVVLFTLGLVYTAKAWNRFSGWITMLASSTILLLSLMEGTFFIDAAQAVANGHPDAAVTSFDLTFVFIRSFFIAPSLLLPLAFVLRKSTILPGAFWPSALALGAAFEILGLVGLFVQATIASIALLVAMIVWIVSAALAFQHRTY
jgi:hypothetical protein